MICSSVVSQLNVVFLIQSVLFFINIHIFDYPDYFVWSQRVRIIEVRMYTHPDREKWKKRLESAIYVTHESVMSDKTSTFESWKKTNKYLPIYSLNTILTYRDLQEVGGEITRNKCVHYRFQEFEIISHCWTCTKQTYWIFIIDSHEKAAGCAGAETCLLRVQWHYLRTDSFAYIIQVYIMLNSSLHGIMNSYYMSVNK